MSPLPKPQITPTPEITGHPASAKPYPLIALPFSHQLLYTLDELLVHLKALRLTRTSLRRLLRSLSVPILHIGPLELVDALSLSIAFRAISRLGAPNFYAPASPPVARGKVPVSSLPPSYVALHENAILSEIALGARLSHKQLTHTTIRAAKAAHLNLIRHAILAEARNRVPPIPPLLPLEPLPPSSPEPPEPPEPDPLSADVGGP